MNSLVFPLWLLGGTVAVSWYTYECAKTKTKFDGGVFWLFLGLGPIALATVIAEALGKRAASAIEARRAETQSGSVADESAIGATSAETPKV